MKDYKNRQEAFWAGEFGDTYRERNTWERLAGSNIAFFARLLSRMKPIHTVIEFGANIGLNLRALHYLRPGIALHAVEINARAISELKSCDFIKASHESIIDFKAKDKYDLAFTKGVLIHIHPEKLPAVYKNLYNASSKYILIAEYYNPVPVNIPYRGHEDKLFKRDFAGEMLNAYADLDLVDYGFVYRRDPNFPLDDINWFLLEKRG